MSQAADHRSSRRGRFIIWKRPRRLIAVGIVLLVMVGWNFSANAQLCIHSPTPLPGLSGPPIWAVGSPGIVRNELSDPRWSASPLESFPQDAWANEAAYRVIQNGNQLSVSLQALVDTPEAQDSVYFGFSSGGTPANLTRIYFPAAAAHTR